jgi:hypothetical protein
LEEISGLETELADLGGATFEELCQRPLQDALEPYRRVLMSQVDRPRLNIGQGPPGRAD